VAFATVPRVKRDVLEERIVHLRQQVRRAASAGERARTRRVSAGPPAAGPACDDALKPGHGPAVCPVPPAHARPGRRNPDATPAIRRPAIGRVARTPGPFRPSSTGTARPPRPPYPDRPAPSRGPPRGRRVARPAAGGGSREPA